MTAPERTRDWHRGLTRRRVIVGGATATACWVGIPGISSAQTGTVGVIPTPERWADADLTGFEIRVDGGDDGTATGDGGDDGGDGSEGDDVSGGDVDTAGAGADGNETGGSGNETGAGAGGGADQTPECDFRDWPPGSVESHEATLVNRHDEETPEEDTTLYVNAEEDVEGNAPYIVNAYEHCDSDHVGVELESVEGARERDDDPQEVGGDDPQEGDDGGPETPDPAGGGDDTPRSGEDGGVGVFGPGFGIPAAVAAVLGWALLRWRGSE